MSSGGELTGENTSPEKKPNKLMATDAAMMLDTLRSISV